MTVTVTVTVRMAVTVTVPVSHSESDLPIVCSLRFIKWLEYMVEGLRDLSGIHPIAAHTYDRMQLDSIRYDKIRYDAM
jgi:hypothetical protein